MLVVLAMVGFRFEARARRSLRALGLTLALSICVAVLQLATPFGATLSSVDTELHDAVLRLPRSDARSMSPGVQANADPRSFITIVAIDERTVEELGAYNGGYPRGYHAQVIENLLAAPPRVIAVDLGFFEPTPDDAKLAAALDAARKLPVPTSVILGAVGLPGASQSNLRDPSGELAFDRALMPVPELATRADVALANMVPDANGTVRSMPLVGMVAGEERPTLGLAAMARYLRRPGFVDARPDPRTLVLAGRSVPLTSSAALRINYSGPPSSPYQPDATFKVVSFVDVLRGRVDPNVWRDGLVFIGASGATGLADDYWTPVSENARKMAGVEIHANVAATVFSSHFLQEPGLATELAIIFGLAILVTLLAINVRIWLLCIAVPLLVFCFLAGAVWMVYARGLLLPVAAPLITATAALVSAIIQRGFTDRRRQARWDAATDSPNRLALVEALQRAATRGGTPHALFVLDVDRFKDVKDTIGYTASELLLREVARRLRRTVPPTSGVARIGANEFAVWLPIMDGADVEDLSRHVLATMEQPLPVNGREVSLRFSVGIALYPEHGDAEDLLRRAEIALHAAKQHHRRAVVFTPELDDRSEERFALSADLQRSVERNELALWYQPKIDCNSGEVAGAEALVRWNHPEFGLLLPGRFIRLAEESGTVGLITRWAVEAAIRQVREWLDNGFEIPIAVNVSAPDLDNTDLPSLVGDLLRLWRVPAQLLTIEITETAVMVDLTRALRVLHQLAAIGVRASLDDFGTGYSSLTAIQQLALQELKIDASFVSEMTRSERDCAIVRSTIQLGHSLHLRVLAEGVEDQATFELLTELGCDLAQGYLFARPMPASDMVQWLRRFETGRHAAAA